MQEALSDFINDWIGNQLKSVYLELETKVVL